MKLLKEIIESKSITFKKGMKNVPEHINNIPLKSWKPSGNWNNVSGQNHNINEPPFPKTDKRKVSGLIIHEPDGRVWLAKPTNGFGGYNHTFPKGGIEKELHPQANAIKEAYEETGIKAHITGHALDTDGHVCYTRYYHAKRETGHPLDHGWESEAVTLAHPNDLHKLLNTPRDKEVASKTIKEIK